MTVPEQRSLARSPHRPGRKCRASGRPQPFRVGRGGSFFERRGRGEGVEGLSGWGVPYLQPLACDSRLPFWAAVVVALAKGRQAACHK